MFLGGGALLGAVFFFWYYASPKYTDVGYAPNQPIDYSHKFHVGTLGLDCRYCHSFVESSHEANIPSTSVCMNCHQNIRKESKDLTLLKDSYENNNPIEWVKVHMLPDYAYFDHSVHLNAGVGCVSCHGRIDQMEVVQQSEPLSMSWCLDCHRNPDDHIRPNTPVTDMDWNKPENHDDIVKQFKIDNNIKPPQDCSACHR